MWLLVAVLLGMAASTANWPDLKVTRWDMFGYYLYLPATTVYHDLDGLGVCARAARPHGAYQPRQPRPVRY
ncbi:hypothetical protein [Hymenobacter sp. BRD67]|uniref:hypothetical protein n=1 Tax=Hymenobacter sp. BRD67 TaxID=2675877 RepID=UPI0015638358|nr:hypothetical protein [Hymenobacter sp. BRD67]QKG53977.1 hypothetical protein GKZ67_16925 [Hymenobacter sp. BRD67]